MDPSSSTQVPQRRLLPSRSRRGGPGVGNCEADQMILETNRRKPENEPLIPENTRFFLTTSLALAPPEAPIPPLLNERANERYFERPQLLKACREQGIIETPHFELINDADTVGGRFRPRGSEEGMVDTSDAAYERRHKKFEAFEKRVRLREKEKLKHEQYKLRERVEQLRVMEYTAFLALPASSFSPAPGRVAEEGDESMAGLPGIHVNGAAAMNEAERRRQEMLDVAQTLEERYKLLLPPDHKFRKTNGSAVSTPAPSVIPSTSSPAAATEPPEPTPVRKPISTKPTKKRPVGVDDGESEVGDEDESLTSPTASPAPSPPLRKLVIKLPTKSLSNAPSSAPVSAPVSVAEPAVPRLIRKPPTQPSKKRKTENPEFVHTPPPAPIDPIPVVPDTPVSNPDIAVLEPTNKTKRRGRPPANPDGTKPRVRSVSAAPKPLRNDHASSSTEIVAEPSAKPPPRKRVRKSAPLADLPEPSRQASIPPIAVIDESVSAPVPRRSTSRVPVPVALTAAPAPAPAPVSAAPPRAPKPGVLKPGVLALHAQRLSELGRPRGATRHLSAFGARVPDEVTSELEYELPLHILNDEVFQGRYARYYDPKDTFNPLMVLIPKFFSHLSDRAYEEQLVEALHAANDRAASEGSEDVEGDRKQEDELEVEEAGEGEGDQGEEVEEQDNGTDEIEEPSTKKANKRRRK
ncbi:hypothetical protein VNI00_002063 [Paramarasmius palmivorus]|uniref:PEHE domain-containing protein n=1 Tax=Paramarasmius palmivorus TaxID=297713 RepID=A0AAW0E3W4_9AGAR